ncbi:MFS general substrate transporter [Trichodelitschia bisporula]|uniref:MFS general substrate transporter n=1 Tax=Trichodelitschia bisporula TaxID=703511 RepID=A0A6G1I8L8_9PEZI|nr:MFS general substrate transporter [Trichodelitschia bisporula]
MAQAFRFPRSPKSPTIVRSSSWKSQSHELSSPSSSSSPLPTIDEEPRLSALRLIVLTCSVGGLQLVWATIMSNGTPFLLTLGLPDSLTAFVWVAAPLCGVLVQPSVGILSDACQLRWGRRRPFIAAGAAGVVVSMLGLASTRTVLHTVLGAMGANIHGGGVRTVVILSAVGWLWLLNFFIQPLQAGIRALIVENCPAAQQTQASAWASRVTGVGNVVGYFFGYVPVDTVWPGLGVSQFTWLSLVAAVCLTTTVVVTCLCVRERDPRELPLPPGGGKSPREMWRYIVWSARTMPSEVRRVCMVQFFAWMGWFPYLFYITSYIGDLYAAPILARQPHMSSTKLAAVIEDAVRLGSLGSLIFSLVALGTNILLPRLVSDKPGARLSLPRAWALSHAIFSLCMFSTLLVHTRLGATLVAAVVGVAWATTLWVPFSIIGSAIAERQARGAAVLRDGQLGLEPAAQEQAGAIMGLHNCAISAPQILAALVSGAIFWAAPKVGSADGIGWVLRGAGGAGLVAAWLAWGMDES